MIPSAGGALPGQGWAGPTVTGVSVHRLRVALLDVGPAAVWRRVHVPPAATLGVLHQVIQAAMGWDGHHLHGFTVPGGRGYAAASDTADGMTLAAVLPRVGDRLGYVYDVGDHWEHLIEVEQVHRPAPRTRYPRCSAGAGACPPEDCGGPPRSGRPEHLRHVRERAARPARPEPRAVRGGDGPAVRAVLRGGGEEPARGRARRAQCRGTRRPHRGQPAHRRPVHPVPRGPREGEPGRRARGHVGCGRPPPRRARRPLGVPARACRPARTALTRPP